MKTILKSFYSDIDALWVARNTRLQGVEYGRLDEAL
jgi:hypothetical protein